MRAHMKMGRLGVWAQVDCMTASAEAEFARDVEQWGYSALWTPEAKGRWQFFEARHRSEEHTSELQSQSNLVCRLLLEKKKLNKNAITSCSATITLFLHLTVQPL